jgi:hypothetical protein
LKNKFCGKNKRIGDISSIEPAKRKAVLEEEEVD